MVPYYVPPSNYTDSVPFPISTVRVHVSVCVRACVLGRHHIDSSLKDHIFAIEESVMWMRNADEISPALLLS